MRRVFKLIRKAAVAAFLATGLPVVAAQEPPDPCPPKDPEANEIRRESRTRGVVVDACGRIRAEGSEPRRAIEGLRDQARPLVATIPVTIDRMTTRLPYGSHTVGGTITVVGSADTYFLSDGTTWGSGAGTASIPGSEVVSVEVVGATIRYVLSPPAAGYIYQQTDYDGGDHSSQGTLGAVSPLVIEAQVGSTTAVMRGTARVVANEATWYGEPRFNYWSAVVGSVVPFETVYTLVSGTWQPDTFTRAFNYTGTGFVDFAHPVSTPRAVELIITGPQRVPDEFVTAYRAAVRYENGVTQEATAAAVWGVDPATFASIVAGTLTLGKLPGAEETLTVRATAVVGGDTLFGQLVVRCLDDDPAEKPGSWPMFQANAGHTGYLPVRLSPESFKLAWRKVLSPLPLNPVAGGEGKVYATVVTWFEDTTHLFALSSRDGAVLWTKTFDGAGPPNPYATNPPSFAYGNVYVQTVNNAYDTWLRAFDGVTGAPLFQALQDAQWERYYAPTLYGGIAYVNGGHAGGLYAFDAYTGAQLWYVDLMSGDQCTPAVDADRVYALAFGGLNVKDRRTGVPAPNFVPDPNFAGGSMNLAPVLGAHGDVIAVNNGRLISFDPAAGSIRWAVPRQFTGQPSVAKDRIYAVDGGRLVVIDELTHADLWSWTAPSALKGPMIVTDSHVLVSTATETHAVDLSSRRSVWSYPAAGHLAVADDLLFIASADGSLTAISLTPDPLAFHTVAPCRVVDTRTGSGAPVGGPSLSAGVARELPLAGKCGVSPTARAVSINVTVTGAGAAGDVRLYPMGISVPTVSTINYFAGQTRANSAVVGLGAAGSLGTVASQPAGTGVNLIVDVNGYFE